MPIEIPKPIRWVLRVLSLPYEEQVGHFPDYVEVPDEIALAFEEATTPVFLNQVALSAETVSDLKRLDWMIAEISGEGKEKFWTMDALESSEAWSSIRRVAIDLCVKFGIDESDDAPGEWYYLRGEGRSPQ